MQRKQALAYDVDTTPVHFNETLDLSAYCQALPLEIGKKDSLTREDVHLLWQIAGVVQFRSSKTHYVAYRYMQVGDEMR